MHVVATAGHVDHGKSTLVRALTGMEPDRWAEERRRGLTIDLGFAWTVLPGGETVAFVDVPGHERFVANMLAGIGPVPAAMLVVAADEGWMPQSAEHLDALHALDVRHGLLVITRTDLFDPEPALDEAHGPNVRHRAGGGAVGVRLGSYRRRLGRAAQPACRARRRAAGSGHRGGRPAVGGPGVRDPRQWHRGHRHPAGRPDRGGRRAGTGVQYAAGSGRQSSGAAVAR